jgi:hypothetical protein
MAGDGSNVRTKKGTTAFHAGNYDGSHAEDFRERRNSERQDFEPD